MSPNRPRSHSREKEKKEKKEEKRKRNQHNAHFPVKMNFPTHRGVPAHICLYSFFVPLFLLCTNNRLDPPSLGPAAGGRGSVNRVLRLAVKLVPVAIELVGRQQVESEGEMSCCDFGLYRMPRVGRGSRLLAIPGRVGVGLLADPPQDTPAVVYREPGCGLEVQAMPVECYGLHAGSNPPASTLRLRARRHTRYRTPFARLWSPEGRLVRSRSLSLSRYARSPP